MPFNGEYTHKQIYALRFFFNFLCFKLKQKQKFYFIPNFCILMYIFSLKDLGTSNFWGRGHFINKYIPVNI